ncbi:MAG: DUF5615 family PIN-like protein [Nitrososphaerales archaeon]
MPRAWQMKKYSRASRQGRVLVTFDKDFGELAFRYKKASKGIVLLRFAQVGRRSHKIIVFLSFGEYRFGEPFYGG